MNDMADVMTYVDRCGYYIPHGEPERTYPARLVFKRDELLYDARTIAFVKSDMMPEDEQPIRHYVGGIGDEGNVDRVTRILGLAHSECVEMLYPYTKEEIVGEQDTLDDVLRDPEEYVIDMMLPEKFSRTTLRLLESLIHEYMLCRILSEWLALTYPDASAYWEEKRLNFREKVGKVLLSRTGRLRRPLKPF